MSEDFSGQCAVVTGAANGLGSAVAEYLAKRGARIVGVDLGDDIEKRMHQLPGRGHIGLRRDLTAEGVPDEILGTANDAVGNVQILVNSAGIGRMDAATDLDSETWHNTLAVNLTASFFMSQAFGRVMVENGYGRIVTIASQAAELGLKGHAAYSASKAGVLGFTRVLAVEWARNGVTVNAVSPTIVATELGKRVWQGQAGVKAMEEIPAGRFAEPHEIAGLVGYVVSRNAGMLNGENVVIDGARSVI